MFLSGVIKFRSHKGSLAPFSPLISSIAHRCLTSLPARVSIPSDELVIHRTKFWVENWVVKHNLCPWAASVCKKDQVRFVAISSDPETEDGIMETMATITSEINELVAATTPDELGKLPQIPYTVLLILPHLDNFAAFLQVVESVETCLVDSETDDLVQLATFHPQYEFGTGDGAEDGDNEEDSTPSASVGVAEPVDNHQVTDEAQVENYTNRSPYPVIQLLGVEMVSRALSSLKYPASNIWKNNIKKMRSIGLREAEGRLQDMLLQQCPHSSAAAAPPNKQE